MMSLLSKPSARWRWILLATSALCGLVVFFAITALNRPFFPFIAELHGERVIRSLPSDDGYVYEFYGFQAEKVEIQRMMERDALRRGWKKTTDMSYLEPTSAATGERVGLALNPREIKEGYRSIIGINRRVPWLERQYETVKNWFGIKRPEVNR